MIEVNMVKAPLKRFSRALAIVVAAFALSALVAVGAATLFAIGVAAYHHLPEGMSAADTPEGLLTLPLLIASFLACLGVSLTYANLKGWLS